MRINTDRLVEQFLDLIRIDGTSLHERAVADALQAQLARWNIAHHEDGAAGKIGGNCGNIIARCPAVTSPKDPVLLMAHLDTVQTTAGVKPVIDNGLIRSDGTTILGADNRAGVAIIMYVLEEIASGTLRHHSLEVVFSVAEELGMLGSSVLDISALQSREGYILDCSRSVGCYVAETPTAIDFSIDVRGRAAHAAVAPEKGINALSMAIQLISQIPVGHLDEKTVANVGTIHGGTATNVVPEHITVTGEIRSFDLGAIHTFQDSLTFESGRIAKAFGGQVLPTFSTGFRGFKLESQKPVVKRLEAELERLGISPEPIAYYGGSDANVLNSKGIASVNIGIGASNPHSCEEQIATRDMEKVALLVMGLIETKE